MAGVGSVTVDTNKPNVKVYEKHVYDDPEQNPLSANHIGYLRTGRTRLTAMGKLNAKAKGTKDAEDYFKINVQVAGKVTMGLDVDGGSKVRVQIMTLNKRVIADSRAGMGRASEAAQALQNGTFNMKKGDYIVKITRERGVPETKEINYAIQFKMGEKFKQDFVSWEQTPPPQRTQPVIDPIINSMQSALLSFFDFTRS